MKFQTLPLLFATAAGVYAQSPPDPPKLRPTDLPPQHERATSYNVPASYPNEFRSIDGSGNNPIDPRRGAANTPLRRLARVAYADGVSAPAGAHLKSPREISNIVVTQPHLLPNSKGTSDYLWQWGQFVDHDLDLTPSIEPIERLDIPVPKGDPYFDPKGTGTKTIELDRSLYEMIGGVRQQINVNTSYIDGSQVYGSDEARAQELRALDGSGRLKTSEGNLLPFNVNRFANVPSNAPNFFLAGDLRPNEQVCLTVMHTLWVREHNYWAGVIKQQDPSLDDNGIYLRARAMVGAELQIITYREFLPLLLGPNAIPPYSGYHPEVDPSVETAFSSAAFRVGHTLLSPVLRRLDARNRSIGDVALADAFFDVSKVTGPGIEPYLRGLSQQIDQEVDSYVVDGLRNFLFGPPGAGGFDLPALNIQRAREHGIPRYNKVRLAYDLKAKRSFAAISSKPEIQARLAAAYESVEDVDLWIGCLAEDHHQDAMVGETIYTIVRDQFLRARDGDRFWYQSYLPPSLVAQLEAQPLSTIIRRNTTITREIPRNVFLYRRVEGVE